MIIAHIADTHIRFGSRHNEYRQVFERLYEDLKKERPDRIYIAGDLNHQKINMSPTSIDLASELLINLAEIAPVDIILGNHDLNLQQIEQGDTVSPIFKIADKITKLSKEKKIAHIVTLENQKDIDFSKNAIYYYPNSGFYNITDKLVYGVYSCKDEEILTLEKKERGKKYVAFYHGPIYGCRGNNGYILQGDDIMRLSTFNNFDVGLFGDIHEYQTFREDESVAFAGSLVQQDYGESLDKGYLLWDLETNTHQRKFILNDYGFSQLKISHGEIPEERIENLRFSNNKAKTKVRIILEDYEENYSLEKENQIKRLIKDKYGCEIVNVNFEIIEEEDVDKEEKQSGEATFLEIFSEYIQSDRFDCDDELYEDLMQFAKEVEKELELEEDSLIKLRWELNKTEISNILSFPETPTIIDWDKLKGITGIFGTNYNGKSNVVKALTWGLYQTIIGGGNASKLVNIYQNSNRGYVRDYLTINDEKYYIHREIKTTINKKINQPKNAYAVEYRKLVVEDGNEKWVKEISDNTATQKTEVKKMIIEAIGSFDDFTKISLQDGKNDYINQDQQPKNDLINRFLGLLPYRLREEYVNEFFKKVKSKIKEIGDRVELEEKVNQINTDINEKNKELQTIEKEKTKTEKQTEETDSEILKLTKTLEKVEPLTETDINIIQQKIESVKKEIDLEIQEYNSLDDWLINNFKKELPYDSNLTTESVTSQLQNEQRVFQQEKQQYIDVEKWLKNNPKQSELNIDGISEEIETLKGELMTLKNQLPTYKGEKCPTCGHVSKEPNPKMEAQCIEDINIKTELFNQKEGIINQNTIIIQNNNNINIQTNNLASLKIKLQSRKTTIENYKSQIQLLSQSENIVKHNEEVDAKTNRFNFLKTSIEQKNQIIKDYKENITKIQNNQKALDHNKSINIKIEELEELKRGYKLSIYNFTTQIREMSGDIKVLENNLENFTEKLNMIKDTERMYKKYSIYIQSVHRDGIPAQIIRNKIPVINNKINSILEQIVDFKIDMKVLPNGDIVEEFYFNEDKTDSLPLTSASSSQKFIATVVIKDALHSISNLIKPSITVIDEGFGSLDDELVAGINNVLQYLKNKYKNVIILTHRDIVKDFVENIIEVQKTIKGVPPELSKHPKAGVSIVTIT